MRYSSPVTFSGRLHFLDALRGLAALSVMIYHFVGQGVSPIHAPIHDQLPEWIALIIQHMNFGVEVFFVLSGFVIAFSMDGKIANLRYAVNFIIRRSVRLDPPYWAAMILMLGYLFIVWPTKWHDFYLMYGGMPGLVANVFYLQNLSFIYPAGSILEVSWTLCLEVQFYLTYLLILVAGHYAGSVISSNYGGIIRRMVVVLLVTAIAVWSFMSGVQHMSGDFAGRAWSFFLGVAIYKALSRGVPSISVVVPLAAMALISIWRQEVSIIVSVATAGVIFAAGITGQLSTLLAYRPLLYLGKISYSIYLMHVVVGSYIVFSLPQVKYGGAAEAWIALVMAIVLSLFSAELLHRMVEDPSNRLSKRLKQRQSDQVPVQAEVAGMTSA